MGLTLFSMFFGAGNLIFPPFMGALAGEHVWAAFAGFVVSAIGLPVLGVAAVAFSDGLPALAGRVHPVFASVFTLLVYLAIGPCLAIPRTAGTSFEMAVTPFLQPGMPSKLLLILYSIGFFAIAAFMAMRPEKLSDRLGKILGPVLLILIAIIFIGCIMKGSQGFGETAALYRAKPAGRGFQDGYQTMDMIAALNFGIIISMNIRAKGVEKKGSIVKETIFSGLFAGAMLLIVYAALTQIGSAAGGALGAGENGAQTLSMVVDALFGHAGNIILGAIFFIACLNTCTGLLSCCSEYFTSIWPKISYRMWVIIFAVFSAVIANAGLTTILKISVPILSVIYPPAIMLIVLAFLHTWIKDYTKVYPCVIGLTVVCSVIAVLGRKGILPEILKGLPLYSMELEWVWAALLGLIIGLLFGKKKQNH